MTIFSNILICYKKNYLFLVRHILNGTQINVANRMFNRSFIRKLLLINRRELLFTLNYY